MCECLRGIFRVTWTPSSDADSDREDSHVFNQTRDPAVKDKRRSPPHRSPSGLTDDQESPERTVQKEKLHAELKQVLSQKRSHLRRSTCKLAQPEMDSEPTDEQTGLEDELRKSVEIVVETDAEVGASGYSVTGGGERGIFVKDVLKDSPAAKHLSLQQGDQLLSAKVYFDNVRYEDALKILQCAEPYKVSFQLKRTVPETEVSVRPRVPGGEVKGPKAKAAKMSVKGTKLFKAQKRRGGRFGLKRLKEKNREELVKEGTPPRLEAGDVNVEFSLPKFKQRKGVGEADAAVGKGKKRIRFPHMKTKSYTGAVTGEKLGTGRLEVDENICPETSGVEVKTKGKGHKFGIAFPKSKHNKSGSSSQTGSLERKPPDVRIHPPSVEFNVSSDKDVEKRGLKFKSPDVEFALPSGKAEASVSTVEETSESKAPKRDVRGEADVAGGKVHADVSKGDAKLRMPKLKLPKVRLSRHSDEIDSAFKVKTPKAEMKRDGEVELPEGNIRMPKVESDLSGGAASVQIPSVDISLPKVKGKFDAGVSLPESGVKAGVNMPESKVSGLDIDLELNTGQKIPDEVEGMFKGPKISMPKVDISLPKTGPSSVEGPDVGGKFSIPSVGIALPQMKSGSGDVDMDCYVGGDGKFKMPEFEPTLPNMKSSDKGVAGTFKLPKVDLTLPKGKEETADDGRAAFQLPSMKVLPPNMKGDKVKVNTEGGMLKMPEVEISPPKVNIQGGFEAEEKVGKEGKFRIPTVDVSMSKLKQPEGHIEGPEMRSGDEIQLPSHDASLPTTKMEGNIETEGSPAKGGNFTKPSFNVKLPKMRSSEAGVDLYGQKIEAISGDVSLKPIGDIEGKVKGGKFTLPSVDISLPKMKLPKGDVTLEGPNLNLSLPSSDNKVSGDRDGVKFKVPTSEISLKKGKIKEKEVNIIGPEAKGGKFQMPSFDVSYTQMKKTSGEVELPKLKGGEIKAPTIEISALQGTFEGEYDLDSDGKEGGYSLPGMKLPEGEGNFQGPKVKGSKFEMPKIDLSLPRGRTRGDFEIEIYYGKDGNIEIPSCDFGVPKGELSADINVDDLEGRTGKLKMPKIDKSLPKLNLPGGEIQIEGPEIKGQMEKPSIDNPEGKLDVDIDSHKDKASKFHMTTVNINLPKIKSKEVSIDLRGSEGQEGNLPSWDITMPDKKFPEADVSLEGPNVSMPGVEVSLPKTKGNVGISVDTPKGNEEKLQMPKFDIALPKVNFPDSGGKIKKLDQKTKKVEMSDTDVLLSKGKAEADIEIDGVKGRKFHIPSVDFSLPRIKTKGSEVKTEGVEGKVCMPDTDVSLSKEKVEGNTNVEGPEVKAEKFKMPKFDISFPNKNLPEGKPEVDFSITKGKIKENIDLGGRFPTVDISLPKLHAKEVDTDIKSSVGANLDISLPKASLPGGDIKIVDPNIKGGKIEMPDIDLCLSKGKPKGDIEITGSSHKGGKFHMPTIDITLPKMKTKGAEVHVEGPEVKGGQIKMPSLDVSGPKLKSPDIDVSLEGPEIGGQIKKPKADISMPKGEVQVDFEAEGPDMKGAKFKMPKFDLSLPKVSLPKFDANVEGPDVKGKLEMPSVDISIPEANTNLGVDVDTGKGSKFHMPSLDISLPKIKTKGPNVNFEGPEVRGDMSLPEIKSPEADISLQGPKVEGGNLGVPTFDVALPKTECDFEAEGPDMKGAKFKMPKFDLSLPKVSLPKFDANVEGPDVKGKAEIPSVDISIPEATTDLGVDVDTGKGSKFHMPSLDISLPKMKTKGPNVNFEGPEVRGGMSLPKIKTPDTDVNLKGPEVERGDVNMPTLDVSLPKPEGNFEVQGPEVKGGKFKMPKLPKVRLPEVDVKTKSPDINVGKIEMPDIDISLPKGKAKGDAELEVHTGKRGKFHMPAIDISLPKIKTKEPEINIKGPEVKGGKIPDIDLSLPRGEVDADLSFEGPENTRGQLKMPKVDVSLPKFELKAEGKVEDVDVELNIDKTISKISHPEEKAKGNVNIEGHSGKTSKFHLPSVDFSLPTIKMKGMEAERVECKGEISIPKEKLQGTLTVEGSGIKESEQTTPTFDISLPKASLPGGDIKIVDPNIKGGKIEMPDIDLCLSKGKPKGDIEITGSSHKGGKFHMPTIDITLPKMKTKGAEVHVEGPEVKGGQIKMPSLDVSGPKLKSPDIDVSLEGPEIGGQIKKPKADISMPKGEVQVDFEAEGPDMKGAKFKMPKFDLSLPKVSLPKFDANVEGPDVKGKLEMPSVDISIPEANTNLGVDVDTGKGSKFHMPSLDISLPKIKTKGPNVNFEGPEVRGDMSLPEIKSPEADISLQGPKVEGGNLGVPTVDVALPKTEGDFEAEGPDMKGAKFKMPKFDLSLPKVSLPKFDANVEGPDVKGKAEMPSVDISIPEANTNLGVDVDTGKGSKFHMPSLDISLPKIKTKGPTVNFEGPEVRGDMSLPEIKSPEADISLQGPKVEGGNLGVPTFDVALPKTECDFEAEGPDMKGAKFKMPKFDLSLPKVSLPKFDANVEGPDVKGKAEIPSVDISIPEATTDLGVDVDTGKGSKFHMPSLDISLPKMKTKGPNINFEGPEVRGGMSLPKIKTPDIDVNLKGPEVERGDVNMPTLDVSLPKPEGNFEVQGPEVKGGKFKMPKLPKVRLPEVDVKTKSPDINVGKIEMPDIDISLPKGKAKGDAELEVHTGKRGKFHMPAIDISLPKIKTKEPEINIKGPEVKGGKIPDIDLSLPRGEVDADLSFEGPEKTRGQLKMPKVDVSLPQIKLAGDVTMECPEMKGKNIEPAVDFSKEAGKMEGDIKKGMGLHMPNMDLHLPKLDFDLSLPSGSRGQVETSGSDVPADVQMSGIKGQLKQPKMKATDASINIEGEDNAGTSLKLPTVKLPTVDISAPKVNLDFGIAKSKGDDVEVELLKAEGGRPSSGGSFDLPDVSLKVPGFSFPRFGGKSKSSELQISKPEVNVSISSPDVEGEMRTPSVEFDDEGKVKVKKTKIKMPSFGLSRKNPDASVTCPEVDVKAKKENVEVPIPNITVKGSDDKTKHKVKPPKFKISSSKAKPPEDEGDVKVEADGKGGFHAPDATIKLPKFSMPGFGSKEKNLGKPVSEVEAKTKLKMPSVELSLPETKTPDTEVLLPKAEVDVSEADIKGYEGNLKVPKMPKIDVSIPKVDLDVSLPKGKSQKSEKSDTDVKGEGKFKIPQITMPSLDVSIPKGKSGDFDSPDVEVDVDRGKFNMPYVKMPSVDITFPKPKIGKPLDADVEGHGKKLQMQDIKMPNINISKEKKDRLEGPDFDIKVGNLKMPNVDVNLSNVKAADVNAHDLETPDGKTEWDTERRFKMPSVDISLPKIPEVDISQPKGQIGGPEVQLTGERGGWKVPHISLPSVDISLPKGRADGPNVERGDGEEKIRTPYTKIPSVDVSVTKDKSVDQNVELKGGGSKFQMPHVKMPNVKLSLPKQKDVSKLEPEEEEEKFKMPSVDISIPMRKSHGPDVEAEVGQFQDPHIKIPHVNISLPKGKSDKNEGANVEIKREGGKSKMPHMTLPSVDISLPRGQTKDYSPEIKGERKHFETAKEDISLPKGRPLVESPEVDMKGDVASMAAAKAEGGNIKLSHMKFPKVDISLPKGRSKGISSPAMEMDVIGSEKEVPKVPSSKADTDLPTVKAQGKLKMPQGAHLDSSSEGGHASLRIKIPTVEMKGSKEDLMLETGSHKEEGNKKSIQLPDLDLTLEGSSGKDKGSTTKGAKFKIRKHKKKTGKDASTKPHSEEEVGEEVKNDSSKDGKDDINVQLPRVTLPSVSVKTGKCDVGGSSPSTADVRIPRIPDIDFDIGTAQDEDDGRTENKIKIPKFGIPLPSISSPERLAHGPEIQYEGPKMPKVKKAVFVLVNPSEPDDSTASLSLHKEQPKVETETEEVTVKVSKKKIKPGFGKSKDKSATESAERKAEEEEKSKGLKMKMPKVKFSPAKSGSFGVKEDRSSPHKDDKGTFGGKLKLPKVELTSPYGKMAAGEENKGARLEKDSCSFEVKVEDRGLPAPAESAGDVVSSQARTEMLDRDSSESPNGFNMEFSSAKVQMWSESKEAEERESSSWFKVPKVTLKPLSSGFLQITPEGSPQAQRKGEVAGMEDVSGSFCIHASGLDFAAQQMSEEHHVSASEEGTVTMVTKTTRITRQLVTSQTHTAESSTTTHQVSDSNL